MSATKYHHHHTIEAALRGQPKQRPILFSTDMVRAILDGRKTQTRRIIKPQPIKDPLGGWKYGKNYCCSCSEASSPASDVLFPYSNPYGAPGDHLYVRETIIQWHYRDGEKGEIVYLDDSNINLIKADMQSLKKQKNTGNWRTIPSIYMPRAAARIHLEITEIKVQRIQQITEADAIAEGINSTTQNGGPNKYYDNYHTGRWMEPAFLNNPILSYQTLWETINGPHSWAANPWVWCINFKKIG